VLRPRENEIGVWLPNTGNRISPAFFVCGIESHCGILAQPANLFGDLVDGGSSNLNPPFTILAISLNA
jgi:hypothetical protein